MKKLLNADENIPKLFFYLLISLYLFFQIWSLPNWIFGGDMWAEMATNYYHNSIIEPLYSQFLITDAGYLPIPQRLIAFFGSVLGLNSSMIPYYYTWLSSFLSAVLVGVFCLSSFRVVIESDFLRFCVCIVNLLVIGFEESTFINFFYLATFFILVCCLYILNNKKTPVWFWLIPLFVISKPAVLAVLPIVLFCAIKSDLRFRKIAFFTCIMGLIQLFQMWYSRSHIGTFSLERSLADIFYISYEMFFTSIGKYVIGNIVSSSQTAFYLGMVFFAFCMIILSFSSSKNRMLIIFGLLLSLENTFLNSVSLDYWNGNIDIFNVLFFNRHTWVTYIGIIFVVVGFILIIFENIFRKNNKYFSIASSTIFILWFVFSGWVEHIRTPMREPSLTYEWQKSVKNTGNDEIKIININPRGWTYEYNRTE
jgi:hypothetical protein